MMDFRSDKMDSREGKGRAKQAWDAYVHAVKGVRLPLVDPVFQRFSANKAVNLVGFWTVWHLHGGFEGLEKLGMSERTIFRQIAWFRMAYGEHPDTYQFAGIELKPEEYWAVRSNRRDRRK